MKPRIFFLAMLCLLVPLAGQAQDNTDNDRDDKEAKSSREAKRMLVPGIRAGVNRANVYDAEGYDFVADSKTGFAGGVYLAIPLGGFIGIQPEILFSQKGFKSTGATPGGSYVLERTSNFLDVPIQLQLKPFRFFTLVGGIQYSYLIKQTDRFTSGTNSVEQSEEFRNDNIRKNIVGGTIGFDINIRHLVLSGRAGWDLRANRGDGSSFTPRYKNVWIQGTVGFRFY